MNKFKWLNKQGVELSGKFIFQSVHRFYFHYIEGDRTFRINTESCFSKNGEIKGHYEIVYPDSIGLLKKDKIIEISSQEKKRIFQNIIEALNFMEIQFRIE